MQSRLLMTHLEASYTFVRMIKLKQHCWVVEVKDHEDVGKGEI